MRLEFRLGVCSCAVVLGVLGCVGQASSAAAKRASFPTQISYAGPFQASDFHGVYSGSLTSSKRACVNGRTVKLFLMKNGKLRLSDTDVTSRKGAWAASGSEFVDGKVTVDAAKVSTNVKCKAVSLVLD